MDVVRRLWKRRISYEPIVDRSPIASRSPRPHIPTNEPFRWLDYSVFLLLGIAMLWAWNMFLAAAPYFRQRFASNLSLLANFQPTEVSVSTITNLATMIVLSKLQAKASYERRITGSLFVNTIAFTLLALSAKLFLGTSPVGYFTFFVIMVLATSVAVGFMQNGTFAYVSGLGQPKYMQAVMTGQGIAGVLPPIVQIVTAVSHQDQRDPQTRNAYMAAFFYFLTATGVSMLSIIAFGFLRMKHKQQQIAPLLHRTDTEPLREDEIAPDVPEVSYGQRKSISLIYLSRVLFFIAAAVFLNFAITMVFPVFTQEILSTHPTPLSPILRPSAFIPLGFFVWSAGDLLGRLIPLSSRLSLAKYPKTLLVLAILRLGFIPLYLLCNIQSGNSKSRGPIPPTVKSDAFYFLVVQLPFGLTNGYIGSCCMMGANSMVEEDEREATGGFMGLCLVGGLAVGSLASFAIGNGT